MTAILRALAAGQSVSGRHLIVTAHPDDETISCSAAMSLLEDVRLVLLTTGAPAVDAPKPHRTQEQVNALAAAGWSWPVDRYGSRGRVAYTHIAEMLPRIREALADVDVVWAHPYEGGHLDHDTAAWLVQTACRQIGAAAPERMEFASYHMVDDKRSAFGVFWPRQRVTAVRLSGALWARKQAALAAYPSQAHILRKFPDPQTEEYRVAPVYDFAQPPPVPVIRWDRKGYQPPRAAWCAAIAAAERAA